MIIEHPATKFAATEKPLWNKVAEVTLIFWVKP